MADTRHQRLIVADPLSRGANMRLFAIVLCAVVTAAVSWIAFTFLYIWLYIWLVATPNTKAVGITVLLVSPLYWLALILMIWAEVWFWRRTAR